MLIVKFTIKISSILCLLVLSLACSPSNSSDGWTDLLDKDLSHWDVFMGVPHTSVQNLNSVPKGDGMNGTPLGLNNDPLNVFSASEVDGDVILKITGEIYGGLTTKKEYSNYHLKLDFKWGEKKWEPRLEAKRDNGLLYHCRGEHGAFWNVWMRSQEFQVQEGDMGDYFGLAGGVNTIKVRKRDDGFYIYDPKGESMMLGTSIKAEKAYRAVREKNYEKPNGEWNTLELVCLNGKSYHIVNGHVVMVLDKAEEKIADSIVPVTSGKIQIQSEAAEAYYRNILITEISELPEFLR